MANDNTRVWEWIERTKLYGNILSGSAPTEMKGLVSADRLTERDKRYSLSPIARLAWSILLLILLSTLHNLHFEWQARNGVFKYDIRTKGAGVGVVKI